MEKKWDAFFSTKEIDDESCIHRESQGEYVMKVMTSQTPWRRMEFLGLGLGEIIQNNP